MAFVLAENVTASTKNENYAVFRSHHEHRHTKLLTATSNTVDEYAVLFQQPRECSCVCCHECDCERDDAYNLVTRRALTFGEWRLFRHAIKYFHDDMKELIETSIGIISPFGTRKYYILSDYTAMILRPDTYDDEEPILTIGQYSHEKDGGFQMVHGDDDFHLDTKEEGKIVEYLPAINTLLMHAMLTQYPRISLWNMDDVERVKELIHWFYEAYEDKDLVITLSASGKDHPEYNKEAIQERIKKRKMIDEENRRGLGASAPDSNAWRKMTKITRHC